MRRKKQLRPYISTADFKEKLAVIVGPAPKKENPLVRNKYDDKYYPPAQQHNKKTNTKGTK